MEKKQTAVEWLVEQIKSDQNQKALSASEWMQVIEQAKEMEKKQIEDAYYDGQSLNAKSVTSQMIIDNSISYYNEIYGKETECS